MIYKTFKEWKAGRWLEDGEPRTEAYTEDELLLVEMGWKYGFDAGKEQTKPLERTDVYGLAIESGFMLSTQHGQAEHKLMPVTDGDTLMALVKAIEERHGIK